MLHPAGELHSAGTETVRPFDSGPGRAKNQLDLHKKAFAYKRMAAFSLILSTIVLFLPLLPIRLGELMA